MQVNQSTQYKLTNAMNEMQNVNFIILIPTNINIFSRQKSPLDLS